MNYFSYFLRVQKKMEKIQSIVIIGLWRGQQANNWLMIKCHTNNFYQNDFHIRLESHLCQDNKLDIK